MGNDSGAEWKTEMRIQKTGERTSKAAPAEAGEGIWKAGGRVRLWLKGMAAICFCLGSFPLFVQAAPATLTSPDATVYEQADEGSSPVGNLVEGSAFEYIGDVTAADGSIWHQITTASGVNGYIRGDREMEIGEEEAAPEEQGGQEASPEAEAGVPGENTPADAGGEAAEASGEAQENAGGDGEIPEEGEGTDENNAVPAFLNMENNQTKKYVLDPSGKIKERGGTFGLDEDIGNDAGTGAGTDMTLLAGIIVVFFCAGAVYICMTRMRMLKNGADSGGMPGAGRNRIQRKIEKKKRRKARKAVQGRKEGVKTPKEKK